MITITLSEPKPPKDLPHTKHSVPTGFFSAICQTTYSQKQQIFFKAEWEHYGTFAIVCLENTKFLVTDSLGGEPVFLNVKKLEQAR